MRTLITSLIALCVGVLLILFSPNYSINPGVLSKGHAIIMNDCLRCHSLAVGIQSTKCASCHSLNKIGTKNSAYKSGKSSLLHTSLGKTDCVICHAEHRGISVKIAKIRFVHELLSPEIISDCSKCHIGDRPNNQFHKEYSLICSMCHSTNSWAPTYFNYHEKYFNFDKNHEPICSNCHYLKHDFKKYTCYNCHEHIRAQVITEHLEEGIRDIDNCVKCHRSSDKEAAQMFKNKEIENEDD